MTFEVIDGEQRKIESERQPFGGVNAHDERTGQAGAARDGDGAKLIERSVSLFESLSDNGVNGFDVHARSHLGKHAAILGVEVGLG